MTTTHTTAAWNGDYMAGVTGQRPVRRSGYDDAQWAAYLEGHAEASAYLLGLQHGVLQVTPFGDLYDSGSAQLMDELGQAGPTTEANHADRLALVAEYQNGLRAGRQVTA